VNLRVLTTTLEGLELHQVRIVDKISLELGLQAGKKMRKRGIVEAMSMEVSPRKFFPTVIGITGANDTLLTTGVVKRDEDSDEDS